MNENQRNAIQKLNPTLIQDLEIDPVLLELRSQGILIPDHVDMLKNAETARERRQAFLEIIVKLDNAWDPFLKALDNANQHYLRIGIESEAFAIPTNQFKQDLMPQLESYIANEAEHIRRFWQEYLDVVELNDIYQPLEVVEIMRQNVQKQLVDGYNFIWENRSRKVFLIDGDPGVGKTTWLNKLATDWTNKTEAIREKFDLLFLVSLRNLTSATFGGLLEYLCRIFGQSIDSRKVENCLKESTTLLLFDGFDENASCFEFISKLTVKNGYHSTIIITSRTSHLDQIRNICDMRLMVKGFKEEAINIFFQLQNCQKSKELFASYSQLPEMCKVPMIAAILCSICKHNDVSVELTKDENRALFIIFENFIKMLINVGSEKRSNVFNKAKDGKNVVEAAGKFALATVKKSNN